MRVHRKGWTYTNLHLSLPIAIEDVDFLDSYLTILYFTSFTRGKTSFDIDINIIKGIWPTSINISNLSLGLISIRGELQTFINLRAFFRSFRKLLCRSLVEKPSPSIQTSKNYITHRIGRIDLLPIYYLTTLLILRFLVGIVVSTLWLNNSQTGKEPLKRLPLGSHGRQECGAWWHVRHIHYLHRS